MFDIVRRRYWYFGLSLLIIIPGLVALLAYGLPNASQWLAIDFTGGSVLELQFSGAPPSEETIRAVYAELDVEVGTVQSVGQDSLQIRSKEISDQVKTEIEDALRARGLEFVEQQFTSVSASVSAEVVSQAATTVAIAAGVILLYLWFAFRQLPHAFRYGTAAILAMLHDVLVVIGSAAIFGWLLGWQVDALFLTALLTVIGFSVHDTIVVFDRIRENLIRRRGLRYEQVVNHSIVQTLDRSINTQLTAFFALLALALFGGASILHFVLTLMIGILSGTYSSIFNAAQILVVWENREWRTWFRRNKAAGQTA
jgi:preprotein translocase subunit SecF